MKTAITQTTPCRQCGTWGDESMQPYRSDMCGYCSADSNVALAWADASDALPFDETPEGFRQEIESFLPDATDHKPLYGPDGVLLGWTYASTSKRDEPGTPRHLRVRRYGWITADGRIGRGTADDRAQAEHLLGIMAEPDDAPPAY